jgi:hypothetical protein
MNTIRRGPAFNQRPSRFNPLAICIKAQLYGLRDPEVRYMLQHNDSLEVDRLLGLYGMMLRSAM